MKRSTWVAAGVASVAVVGLLAWAFAPRPVEVEVATATQAPFRTTIDEDGKTRVRDRYVVSAPLAGQLLRMGLREGDRVEAGAVVAQIVPTLSPMLDERTLRDLQARLGIAQAQVERVKARVEGARIGLEQARSEATRTEQLASQGFVSLTKLEVTRLSAEAAQKELEAATQERHVANHEVEQARNALAAVRSPQQSGRGFALRAPVAGRVLRVAQVSETVVPLGTPLLELGDTARQEIVAELLTTDALRVQPGAAVLVERWGGTGSLQGQVRLIEPAGFTKVSALGVEEQRVRVLIDITSPPAQWAALGDGYRVGVRVVTLSLDQAVQVPVSAVFPLPAGDGNGDVAFGVFRLDGGRARLTPVKIGARNGSHAWVQQGLPVGATVIVYPPTAVRDGLRVKPRAV
ncbi:HlyD family efflux transporter periplasmic adaptor subunit [Rhizobacter sp. J219]|jgi:HlyD family secretion protein|uniref:efflux RND transporter periplasmic adaptor subunit n=1 Tax=Rhizobacter sp. J219 TaxID=2898430 RepID=UPI002150DC9A|nr:HlyD family efflux transporter periplasmic adaptor subunit [Rhizobacter sp. J219]MCR5882003.1 HlyD family efflux transporter periplasmic adaptor subunit [Rhizobacter sp. J219]